MDNSRHYITLDFETYYDKKFSLKRLTYEQYIWDDRFAVHGVGLKVDDGPTEYHFRGIAARLKELFGPGNNNVLICHNTMFDGGVLNWHYGLHAAKYYCTERMSNALWNQQSASLDRLAKHLFPDDPTKRKGKELAEFEGKESLSIEDHSRLGRYCKNDVNLTWHCFHKMYSWMPDEELDILDMTLKMFVIPCFTVNRETVETHLANVIKDKNDKVERASKFGATEKILASNDQFAQWIRQQGIPLEKIPSPTPKKPDNTKWPLAKNAEEFINIQTEYPQFADVWEARLAVKSTLERSRAKRILEHSETNWCNPEGRIAMPLNYAAAHTLRWGGTNKVNPQNFGRESQLRLALEAPPGYMVVVADASNIEARLLAWFSGDPTMIAEFQNDEDLYANFASGIFGKKIVKSKEFEIERFIGKTCILGLGFQTGARKLRTTLATSKERLAFSYQECLRMVNLYRSKYERVPELWTVAQGWIEDMAKPGMSPYAYKCIEVQPGRIKSPTGMYLNYPKLKEILDENDVGGGYRYHNGKHLTKIYGGKLVENIIQHLARCILRDHMLAVSRYLEPLGGRIALQVHDEIVTIIPEHVAHEAFERIKAIMRIPPDWCNDGKLVLDAEGAVAKNYGKF